MDACGRHGHNGASAMNEPEELIPLHGGYPPDKQEKATQTVLEQAKLLCVEWAG